MPHVDRAGTEPDKPSADLQAGVQVEAERALRRGRYPALKNLSCDYQGGVLVLRGSLPSYYLKQVAQEVVARLEGVQAVDNQIQVGTPASR